MATYTFTGQCYSQSGNTKKYESDKFYTLTKDTSESSTIDNSCFYYSQDTSYWPSYMGVKNTMDFAYFTYSGGITNPNTGEYEYTFTAYAKQDGVVFQQTYVYVAVINGNAPLIPPPPADTSYKYALGQSYDVVFCTNYGPSTSNLVKKQFNVSLAILSYWSGSSVTPTKTWYTKKISFVYNANVGGNYEFVGVYLFNISTPGQFLDTTGTGWTKLGLKEISTFSENISTSDADSGIASGYVFCSGTSLSSATLKVFTESISNKTSAIASKTVSIGTAGTIYVIGIRRNVDSTTGGRKIYRYSCSDIEELTLLSWSTTKPSV
jgi:hypothetical protein